jgi:hypothetical protein
MTLTRFETNLRVHEFALDPHENDPAHVTIVPESGLISAIRVIRGSFETSRNRSVVSAEIGEFVHRQTVRAVAVSMATASGPLTTRSGGL